ncbi:MAG: hypothetical protein ACR2IV_17150 [Bryobacteraceae bacterium]
MSKPTDDLEAVRIVVEAIAGFEAKEQQRILRWVAEKVGLPEPFQHAASHSAPRTEHSTQHAPAPPGDRASAASTQDIKSFVTSKNPRSDVQFAATVAYYFQFEAPPADRKKAISKDDLQEACRKADRERLGNPGQTLRNAHKLGMLDRGEEPGTFSINTVGENLVAMTLPGDSSNTRSAAKGSRKKLGKVQKLRLVNQS